MGPLVVDALLALSWAGLVLVAARRVAPSPVEARARRLAPGARRPVRVPSTTGVARVGGALLRVAGRPSPPEVTQRLGRAAIAAVATLAVLAPAAPAVGALVWALPGLRERSRHLRTRAALVRDLPEVTDLFALAVGAGLTVPLAVEAVARRAPGRFAAELRQVIADTALGRRLSDALEEVPARLGDESRPLVAALVASDRYGAPLLDGLERLGVELRNDRRRRAEEAARRVPVKLLFPLVFCTLPAFALLTVAPLLAGALGALRL